MWQALSLAEKRQSGEQELTMSRTQAPEAHYLVERCKDGMEFFFEDREPTKLSHRRNKMEVFLKWAFWGEKNLQMFSLVWLAHSAEQPLGKTVLFVTSRGKSS